jgi:hypothetical protein
LPFKSTVPIDSQGQYASVFIIRTQIDEKWKRKKEFTKTKNLLLKNKIGWDFAKSEEKNVTGIHTPTVQYEYDT